ncbi:MAG TPA: histidine kinase [Chitinophagaceae bacterium]
MIRIKDKWLRIIGITCIMAASVYSNRFYIEPLSWTVTGRLLLTLGSIILTWEGNRFIILYFRKRYTGSDQLVKRLALVFLTGMAFTLTALVCTAIVRYFIMYDFRTATSYIMDGQNILQMLGDSVTRSALLFILFLGIYEAMYYYAKLKQTEEEKKQLEKEKLWAQLENLKQQVNPHFLFNTLNSLSSLITEDPAEAERFVDEMSKVYRYLLETNKHELVTLETEIKFISSYYRLLKIRHSEGVVINMEIDERYNAYLLPPLTLQLLVENAVKHNITSKNSPLYIEISTTAQGQLLIKNNLQRKTAKVPSHKIGLENIAVKYQLMQQGGISANESGDFFIVTVPLITPGIHHPFEQSFPGQQQGNQP